MSIQAMADPRIRERQPDEWVTCLPLGAHRTASTVLDWMAIRGGSARTAGLTTATVFDQVASHSVTHAVTG
jgi:hypothetical protein